MVVPPRTEEDRTIDKLRKLLAKAESAKAIGSQAEAEIFAAKVQELLLKYKLEMTDLDIGDLEKDGGIDESAIDPATFETKRNKTKLKNGKSPLWVRNLAMTVANGFCCRAYFFTRGSRVMFVGAQVDRESAMALFKALVVYVADAAFESYEAVFRANGRKMPTPGYYDNFHRGFCTAIRERLIAQKKALENDCRALVVTEKAVVQYMEKKNLRTSSHTKKHYFNEAARKAGYAAGYRANMGGGN